MSTLLLTCAASLLMHAVAAAPTTQLFAFRAPAVERIEHNDATLTSQRDSLQMAFGHTNEYPGIVLPAPQGTWNLSANGRLNLSVRNAGTTPSNLHCRVDNAGCDGVVKCVYGTLPLEPGQSGTLTVALTPHSKSSESIKLFGMRGYPVGYGTADSPHPEVVNQLVIYVDHPGSDSVWQIHKIWADGTAPKVDPLAPGESFLPFVDTFGQYAHRNWPGKIKDLADIKSRVTKEAADLKAHPAPADRDKWGGWKDGPQLEATGFFRTAKVDGKWWLVDPDGRLFWSHGIDCVGASQDTGLDRRDGWWQNPPFADPQFASFRGEMQPSLGDYAGQKVQTFSFSYANLQRKYGAGWQDVWFGLCHTRLASWGLNTIGNWSMGQVTGLDRTPYTATVGFGSRDLEGSRGYWGKFRDVFDPSFASGVRDAMKTAQGVGDPYCLGYFVDNEIAWGNDVALAVAALRSPADQPAKKVFAADLQAKYGDIAKLNAAWGASYVSWDALLASTAEPDQTKAIDDLHAFYTKTAETYFKTIADAVHAVAPHQLYLGCRFAEVNDLAQAAAGKFCDVVSFNRYELSIANFKAATGDKPLLIGEFHFGALDRGMLHTGLVPTTNQKARAAAYRSYVEGALRHPQWVGTHWFQFQDEPLTGRFDGENYQIGFIDGQDTPYPETIAAARAVGAEMYRLRAGASKK